jgi:hypothetical protein
MTTTASLRKEHASLLRKELNAEHLRPYFVELSRLVAAALDHAAQLESRDINEILTSQRKIGHIWGTEDVLGLRSDLTDDQAWEVLQEAGRRLDSGQRVTWDMLKELSDELFQIDGRPA